MLFIKQLFRERRWSDWKYQYRTLRAAIDWVVWLYVLIPALLIIGYHYLQLWNMQVEWPHFLSMYSIASVLYLLSWTGNARLFVEPADQLLFRQHQERYRYFLKLGFHSALIVTIPSTLFLFFLLFPILFFYLQVQLAYILLLFLLVYCWRLLIYVYKQYLDASFQGWRKKAVYVVTWLIGFFLFQLIVYLSMKSGLLFIAVLLLLVGALRLLLRARLEWQWTFVADYIREGEQRLRIAKYFLQSATYLGAPDLQRKKGRTLSRPIFIIKKNRSFLFRYRYVFYFLLLFKYIYRDNQRRGNLLQIISVCFFAVWLIPDYFKYGMLTVALIIFIYFQRIFWEELLSSGYLSLFTWDGEDLHFIGRRIVFLLSLPFVLSISLLTGILSSSLYGIFIVMGASLLLSYFLCNLFIHPHQFRKKEDETPSISNDE